MDQSWQLHDCVLGGANISAPLQAHMCDTCILNTNLISILYLYTNIIFIDLLTYIWVCVHRTSIWPWARCAQHQNKRNGLGISGLSVHKSTKSCQTPQGFTAATEPCHFYSVYYDLERTARCQESFLKSGQVGDACLSRISRAARAPLTTAACTLPAWSGTILNHM